MGNLIGRLNKIEQSIPTVIGAESYIKAMEMYLSGEDDGEALKALPSLDRPGAPLNNFELFVHAHTNLEIKARLEGKAIKLRKDLQDEGDRRLAECGLSSRMGLNE